MSKPRFTTICQQARNLMVKIPNKSEHILSIIENYPKAAEIFFAEGMYWELYEYDKKYPRIKSSISALEKVIETHKSLPPEVFVFMKYNRLAPCSLYICGRRAERAVLANKDVIEAMKGYEAETMISILNCAMEAQENVVNISSHPLTKGQQFANRTKIIELLKETENKDVFNKLIPALNNTNNSYFTKAHCKSHHNNYDGALAQHSLGVCMNALSLAGNRIPKDKVIMAALLHDLCDVRDFRDKNNNHVYGGPGHGKRSIELLSNLHVHLDNDVEDAIRYHLGSGKRSEKEKRELAQVWANPLFSVLYVADHLDAGYRHCDEVGFMGAESYLSLDCSELHKLQEFKQLKGLIQDLAKKYHLQLKTNKYGTIDWNPKRCSMRLLELGEKPWNDLIPLVEACRRISKKVKECGITVSKIAVNKNNLVLIAELDSSLIQLRDQLQSQFSQQGYPTTFTKNLTVKIAEITNAGSDITKFLEESNQLVYNYKFNADAINLHYYRGLVAGLYYFKSK